MKNSLILIGIILSSCGKTTVPSTKDGLVLWGGDEMEILTIDGCEYIAFGETGGDSRSRVLTHKGNCKNPIHYNQKKCDTLYIYDTAFVYMGGK